MNWFYIIIFYVKYGGHVLNLSSNNWLAVLPDLRLDQFPRLVCPGCRGDFQTLVDFRRRINEGQLLLHQLLGTEGPQRHFIVHIINRCCRPLLGGSGSPHFGGFSFHLSSVVDPDPYSGAFWIRIRIRNMVPDQHM